VVLDTSLLVAYANRQDRDHERARALMSSILKGEHGTPIAPDYVLDEGLTVLQARAGRAEHARTFASYLVPIDEEEAVVELYQVDEPLVEEALELFFERFERGLSFTDAVVACLARRVEGSVVALEGDFEGIVATVGG
jgi:predicted nucleic acid-binding protein